MRPADDLEQYGRRGMRRADIVAKLESRLIRWVLGVGAVVVLSVQLWAHPVHGAPAVAQSPYSCRLLYDEQRKCAFGACDKRVVERLTASVCATAAGHEQLAEHEPGRARAALADGRCWAELRALSAAVMNEPEPILQEDGDRRAPRSVG